MDVSWGQGAVEEDFVYFRQILSYSFLQSDITKHITILVLDLAHLCGNLDLGTKSKSTT